MADSTPKSYHTDPTLWVYTSLTAGSSQIITATSRLEGILKANKIPFKALDVATDEKARMLWGRRAGKRKLPGLVRMGMIVGNFEEVEEWNEYGEIKEHIGSDATSTPTPSAANTPSKPPPSSSSVSQLPSSSSAQPLASTSTSTSSPTTPRQPPQSSISTPLTLAMRQAGQEAAKKANDSKKVSFSTKPNPSNLSSSTLDKLNNSAPTGLPPPSGTTSAESAIGTETGDSTATSSADLVPLTTTSESTAQSTSPHTEEEGRGVYTKHRGLSEGLASKEETKEIENNTAIKEENEDKDVEAETTKMPATDSKGSEDAVSEKINREGEIKTSDVTTKGDEAEGLQSGGKNTQEQGAADAADVSESVLD